MPKLYVVLSVLSLEGGKRTFRSKREALEYAEDQVGADGEARYVAKVIWLVEQSVVHVKSLELEEEGIVEGETDDQEESHSSSEET